MRDQIAEIVKGTCQYCSFTVHHIQDVQLTCCGNRLDALAIRATISSSENVTLGAILTTIKHWVASKPTLPGWDSVLRVSNVTQLGTNDTVYVECTSPDLEQQQKDEGGNSQTNVLISVLVVVIAVVVAGLVAGLMMQRYSKKKILSHAQER